MFFVYAFFVISGTYTGDYNTIISDTSSSCVIQDAIFDNFDLKSSSQSLISIGSTSTTLRITTTTFYNISCSSQGDIYSKGPTTLEKTCATRMENTVTAAFLKHENTNIQMTYVSVTDSPSSSNKIIIDSRCNGNFQYVNVSDVYAMYASLNYLSPSQPIMYSELINSTQTNQALFVQTTNGQVNSCIFYKNNGPACFIEKITGSVISNCYFMDNRLDLLFISSTVTVTNCYFWYMTYSGSSFSVTLNVHTYGAGFPENYISNDPNWGKANYKCDYYTFQPPTWVNLPAPSTPVQTVAETPFSTLMMTAVPTAIETPYTTVHQTAENTPFETHFMFAFQTAIETPFITMIETEKETPFNTVYMTPFSTAEFTPFITPYETNKETPFITPIFTNKETPFSTIYMTLFSTAELTPFITPYETKGETPYLTPIFTNNETPFITPVTTPFSTAEETPYKTPYSTSKETPFLTIKYTNVETPVETVKMTVKETPVETVFMTPKYTFMPTNIPRTPVETATPRTPAMSPHPTTPVQTPHPSKSPLPENINYAEDDKEYSSKLKAATWGGISAGIVIIATIITIVAIKFRRKSIIRVQKIEAKTEDSVATDSYDFSSEEFVPNEPFDIKGDKDAQPESEVFIGEHQRENESDIVLDIPEVKVNDAVVDGAFKQNNINYMLI